MKFGVIAGSGSLPTILTQQVKKTGRQVIVVSITKDADESLKDVASEFHQISIGQVKKIINTLVNADVKEVSIIGKVSKNVLFNPYRFDTKAIKILSKIKDKSDSSLFSAIADEIESSGIKLVDQRLYLSNLLPEKGVLTTVKPSKSQLKDIEYGMDLAKKSAELGIGQTVIVKDGIVIAVEAIEGTDFAIRRAGNLCDGGMVVAKSARQGQDFRFDVPTVGPKTIDALIEANASVLAIEYQKAFLIEPELTIQKANDKKIVIVVV
ncbi:MAG: LpxI family protein [Candidatus Poribacteria bacterium]